MNIIYPAILMTMTSPYFKSLHASWRRNKQKILDTTDQLQFILEETQSDVYNQFSEKQGEWKTLAKYTVQKKTAAKSDMRILHETKGANRMKDTYASAGYIDGKKLIYHYPSEKAREHQEGAVIDSPTKAKQKRKGNRGAVQKAYSRKLDTDYLHIFGSKYTGLFD